MKLEKNWKKISLVIAAVIIIGGAILLITPIDPEPEPDIDVETYELEIPIGEISVDEQTKGTVEITPEKEEYEEGTEVTLKVTPEEGWKFLQWDGDHESEESETKIEMDSDKRITVHFKEKTMIEGPIFEPDIIFPAHADEVPLGREIQVIYSITNTEETEDTQTIEFIIDEEVKDSREHTLEPGEEQEDTFTWTPEQKGEQELRVRSNKRVRIRSTTVVEYPDPETPSEVVEAYIWFLDNSLLEEMEELTTGERKEYFEELTEEDREGIKYSTRNSNTTITEILEQQIDEEAGEATVEAELNWEASWDHGDYEETSEKTYHLQQEQGEWKIAEIE